MGNILEPWYFSHFWRKTDFLRVDAVLKKGLESYWKGEWSRIFWSTI